ncbi:MAG: hypothetical protein U0575_14885 [Phycisphaerales bacterium]
MSTLTERLAIHAAQLVVDGGARDVEQAIRLAVERLGAAPSAAPTAGLVRQHLQPMLMQSLGADGYAAMTRRRLEVAEETMTVFAERNDVLDVVLAGRAAAGHLDGDLALHVRVYTRRRIGELAQDLVDVGFAEPRFATAETRFGRLDRLIFVDGDVEVIVTRCLPEQRGEAARDLFNGRRVAHVRLPALRSAIA